MLGSSKRGGEVGLRHLPAAGLSSWGRTALPSGTSGQACGRRAAGSTAGGPWRQGESDVLGSALLTAWGGGLALPATPQSPKQGPSLFPERTVWSKHAPRDPSGNRPP